MVWLVADVAASGLAEFAYSHRTSTLENRRIVTPDDANNN